MVIPPGVSKIFLILLPGVVLGAAGCAILSGIGKPSPRERSEEIEPLLSGAGFKMLPADTSQRLDALKNLPQLQLKYYPDKEGGLRYWMADAQFCHCLYLGDEHTYQKYREMRFEQRLTEQQSEAAQEQMQATQEEQMEMMDPFGFGLGSGWVFP